MDTKLSNVIGAPFPPYVLRQLAIRAGRGSAGRGIGGLSNVRTQDEVLYLANKSAWARLISSVDLDFTSGSNTTEKKYNSYIDALGVAGSGTYPDPNSFAKNWILEAGTSTYTPTTVKGANGESIKVGGTALRQGLGPNGAYGLGGTEELGYRPMPGLTSVTIDTTGRLGSLRTATINFKVWNMNQLNAVEALYFRLGYSMLLEWGHTQYFKNNDKEFTSIQEGTFVSREIYGIGDPFLDGLRKEKVQQLIEQKKFETSGNYDGMLGIVVNFNWSFNQDGGYDCMIRLVGLGAVINSMRINQVYKLPEGAYKKYRQAVDSIEADKQAQLAAQLKDIENKEGANNPVTPSIVGDYPANRSKLEELETKYDSFDPNTSFSGTYGVHSAQRFTGYAYGQYNVVDYVGVFETKPELTDQGLFEAAQKKLTGIYLSNRGPNRAFVYVPKGGSVFLDTKTLGEFATTGRQAKFASNAEEKNIGDLSFSGASVASIFEAFLRQEALVTKATGVVGAIFGDLIKDTSAVDVDYNPTSTVDLPPFGSIPYETRFQKGVTEPLTIRQYYATAQDAYGNTNNFYLSLDFKIPGAPNNIFSRISFQEFIGGNSLTPGSGVKAWEDAGAPATITEYEFSKNSGESIKIKGTFEFTVKAQYKNIQFSYDEVKQLSLPVPVENIGGQGFLVYTVTVRFETNNPGFILGTSRLDQPPPTETKKEEPASALSDEKAKQAKAAAEQIEAAQAFESALHAMLTVVQTGAQAAVLRTQDRSKIVDITDVTQLLYKTGVLNGIFEVTGSTSLTEFNLLQYAAKGFSSQLMVSANPKVTFPTIPYVEGSTDPLTNNPNFKQLCQALVIKYKQESTSTVGITYAGDYKVYITLGYLLAFINSLCLFYDSDTTDINNNSQKRPYVYIDFNPETNFCLTSPQQFSIDPEVCLIPANLNDAQYQSIFPVGIKPAEPFKTGTAADGQSYDKGDNAVSKIIDASKLRFKSLDNPYRGKTMHIFVCTQYLLGALRGFSTSDPQHAVALQPFLERVMVDINKALGNMNLFRVAYRDDSNTVQIQDDQYVPLLSGEPDAISANSVYKALADNILQSGELPIFSMQVPGPGGQTATYPTLGIAREMQLKTAMSSKMASMLAISAQASTGSVNATDHSEISWLNRNFKDRYKPYIQDVGSNTGTNNNPPPDGNSTKGNTKATEKKASPESPDQKAANLFNTHVKAVYGQYDVNKEVIQLAKNYYIERMSKVKAADLITSAAPFIPAEMEVTLDGISGIVMGNAFNIPQSRLPYSYRQGGAPEVAFITNGLTHTIENNQWVTKVKGQMIKLRQQSGLGIAVASPTGKQVEGQLYNAGVNKTPATSGGGAGAAGGNGPGAYGYWGASPYICTKNAKGEIVPEDCYGGGLSQISPDTPGYPNVSINNANVQEYFPGLKYEKPNAVSNINIAGISTPEIVDQTNQNRFKIGRFGGPPQAFIVHHTAGALGRNPISTFYSRGFPTQYWIDEKGTIYQFIPDGLKGQHMRNGNTEVGAGLSNSNTIGVEIAAPDCGDVTTAQKNSAIYLAYMLGFNRDQVFGHGEVNTHKQACEGKATAELIRKGQIAT